MTYRTFNHSNLYSHVVWYKGWKVPGRATTEEGVSFRPSCMPAEGEYEKKKNPVELAKDRLMSLEAAIERRYLKPPLGVR